MIDGNMTVAGSEKDALDKELARREMLMRLGVAGLTITLNGGSDTRRGIRDYWKEYARELNIGFQCYGNCIVVVGGPGRDSHG